MLFTTYQFALFVFVLFVIYYLVNKKYQWIILLIGSYLFYAYYFPCIFAGYQACGACR